jgi:hypothetical protein
LLLAAAATGNLCTCSLLYLLHLLRSLPSFCALLLVLLLPLL